MQDAIRRSNINDAPRVQREFTNQYKVSGMYADNSMSAQNLRIQQVAKNQQRIERHLVKHRKKETMLKILKVDYGLSTSKLIELNFRDEQTILVQLRRAQINKIQRQAVVKIQAAAKMYMIRKRYIALVELRKSSAFLLTRYFRTRITLLRFQRAWRGIKSRACTMLQKLMRG